MAAPDNYSAADSRVPASPADEASGDDVVLWVRLARGDPLTGWIGEDAQPTGVSFHGWIDFMGAINDLRQSAARPGPG